jgi:excisionase family DNA binding protein
MAKYLTMKQICELLQVKERTIFNYIKSGMPAYKLGKEWRFIEEEVDKWVKEMRKIVEKELSVGWKHTAISYLEEAKSKLETEWSIETDEGDKWSLEVDIYQINAAIRYLQDE